MSEKEYILYHMIIKYIQDNGYAPTFGEMCEFMGGVSKSIISRYIKHLCEKGYIEVKPHTNRAIKVIGYKYVKA